VEWSESGLDRSGDLLAMPLGVHARFAKDFASRPQRQLELDCVVKRVADHHAGVDPFELDFCIAGDLELPRDDAAVGHRERTWTAGLRVIARRRR